MYPNLNRMNTSRVSDSQASFRGRDAVFVAYWTTKCNHVCDDNTGAVDVTFQPAYDTRCKRVTKGLCFPLGATMGLACCPIAGSLALLCCCLGRCGGAVCCSETSLAFATCGEECIRDGPLMCCNMKEPKVSLTTSDYVSPRAVAYVTALIKARQGAAQDAIHAANEAKPPQDVRTMLVRKRDALFHLEETMHADRGIPTRVT